MKDAGRIRAARILAGGGSQAQAARETGKHRSTIKRWLEDPDFQDLLAEQRELLEAPAPLEAQATKGLSDLVPQAIALLEEALSGGAVPAAQARVALDVVIKAATLRTSAETAGGETSLAALLEQLDARSPGSD